MNGKASEELVAKRHMNESASSTIIVMRIIHFALSLKQNYSRKSCDTSFSRSCLIETGKDSESLNKNHFHFIEDESWQNSPVSQIL